MVDGVFEEENVRVIEVVEIGGEEIEGGGLYGGFVLFCQREGGEEEGSEEEAAPAERSVQPHGRDGREQRIKIARWLFV